MQLTKVLFAVLPLTFVAFANAADDDASARTQLDVVIEYRELRGRCAVEQGDARRACFKELSEKTLAYTQAKQDLKANGNPGLLTQIQ